MTTPAPDLQETVELWLCALRLLPHDPRALAALMESGMLMPTGVQYLLGEMLDPGFPPLTDVRVVPRRSKALTKAVHKLNASREYKHRMRSGQSSQDAALDIVERFGMAERQIYN